MWPFGNNYPYTNYHDLNLDWIVHVVHDFLDQYTNIQNTITAGENSIVQKGQEVLALLNQWYSTHSNDIADELANALTSFTAQANQIVASVIETIPQDYTELSKTAQNLDTLEKQLSNALTGESITPALTIGYSIDSSGHYFRAWGNEEKRAATELYSESLDGFTITVDSPDITFNVYYYYDMNESAFVSSAGGPFTSEHIFTNPYSKYFRVVLMSENNLPSNVQTLFHVTSVSKITDLFNMLSTPKNAYYPIEFTIEPGAITPNLSVNADTGEHARIPVKAGEKYLIDGYVYFVDTYPLFFFRDNYGIISTYSGNAGKIRNYEVTVPEHAVYMYVNARHTAPYDMQIFKKIDNTTDMAKSNYLNSDRFIGKTIIWYGTSIPANGFIGSEHPEAYPQQVGKLLNANVINKAVGSSCIYCKDPTRINANNPYGFTSNFESASRCLTNSIQEMEWICDHYNSSIWTSGAPAQMTEQLRNQIKSFSYENMLLPYLTDNTMPFLFVFDHGFNDSPDTHNYYETYGDRNLYTYRGGMNFLIENIFAFSPYANIIIIGNYDNREAVYQMQEAVANDWSIPIIKQNEYLKFSRTKSISVYGKWQLNGSSYQWVTDSNLNTMTMKDRLIPDHVHPWSDPTGKNVRMMTEGLYRELLKITFE